MMEKTFAKAENLAGYVKEYIDVKLESIKLSIAKKVSAILSNIIASAFVLLALVLFLVFISFALAFFLGELLGHIWLGFLIVGFICLIKAIIIWKIKDRFIRTAIMNSLIKQLAKTENDEEI